ncbi:cytochrome b [Halomonas maura]|uniref:cytochrome b n=1 Tax=Halomonas maura TaxID=117606 RepID=UPI0025B43262|nr:cytochrome b/b6 domain-containing protein [Halomonas maura]MDN3555782.1 cytochrome b/b6 domain-containing protein [Halomonas maura]
MTASPIAHYGRISRLLHWGMAALFAFQFVTAGVHFAFPDTALEVAVWGAHMPLGALLMLLVVVRVLWAVIDRPQRPSALNRAATLGHLALYALMVGVPVLALLRQYGSGRAFAPFGVPLMPGFEGEEVEWMTALGGLLHGELAWALLALIAGHVGMVLWHRRMGGQDVRGRMTAR